MRAFLLALVWALLAAAGLSGRSEGAPPNPRDGIANPGSDRLRGLSPLNQRIALGRAIRASREPCRRVVGLGYQQQYHTLAMWVALCEGGRRWAVFIAPNEEVQVRDCAEHAQLNLPACRPIRARWR